jgi:hypothetical protein
MVLMLFTSQRSASELLDGRTTSQLYLHYDVIKNILGYVPVHELISNNAWLLDFFDRRSPREKGICRGIHHLIYEQTFNLFIPTFRSFYADETNAEIDAEISSIMASMLIVQPRSFLNFSLLENFERLLSKRSLPILDHNTRNPLPKLVAIESLLQNICELPMFQVENMISKIKSIYIAGSYILRTILLDHPSINYQPGDIDIYIAVGKTKTQKHRTLKICML